MPNQIQAGTMIIHQSAALRSLKSRKRTEFSAVVLVGTSREFRTRSEGPRHRLELVLHGRRNQGGSARAGRTQHSAAGS